MVRQRPRRMRQRAQRANGTKHLIRTVQRTEMGHEITPTVDPPPWTAAPWWPMTLTMTATADVNITVTVLFKLLVDAIDLVNSQKVNNQFRLRVIDIRAWGLNRQPIGMKIFRLNGIGSIIKILNDRGGLVTYSRVGWHFGLDSQVSLPPTVLKGTPAKAEPNDTPVCTVDGAIDAKNQVLIYFRVLFQSTADKQPGLIYSADFNQRELSLANELSLDSMAIA